MSYRALAPALAALIVAGSTSALRAQAPEASAAGAHPPGTAAPDRGNRRLFQRFVEDAAITPGGWVEGQYLYENLPDGARHFAGPLLSFKVVEDLEAGMRFGFLHLRPDAGPTESGLSDVDLYAKYRLPGGRGRFALGGLVKAATADEAKGLGPGKTDVDQGNVEILSDGVWRRADLEAVTLVANAGIRFNGEPDPPAPSARDSILFGGAIVMPATPTVSFVVEATYESKRRVGGRDDARLTAGLQVFGPQRRGGLRGAVAFPLSDGAPDLQMLLGAFLTY